MLSAGCMSAGYRSASVLIMCDGSGVSRSDDVPRVAASPGDLYSPLAEEQPDELQAGPEEDLYNAVLDSIDRILDVP